MDMPDQAKEPLESKSSQRLRIIDLLRPHWKALTIALVAVLGETLTDILEPWPIKIVVDNILQSKKLPPVLGGIVTGLFGRNPDAIVNFAVAAVAIIAIVGAVSSYFERYLTASVSQWVAHDLRRGQGRRQESGRRRPGRPGRRTSPETTARALHDCIDAQDTADEIIAGERCAWRRAM